MVYPSGSLATLRTHERHIELADRLMPEDDGPNDFFGVSKGRSLYQNEMDNDFHLHFNSKDGFKKWLVCTGYCI